jgi:hypothetical protein
VRSDTKSKLKKTGPRHGDGVEICRLVLGLFGAGTFNAVALEELYDLAVPSISSFTDFFLLCRCPDTCRSRKAGSRPNLLCCCLNPLCKALDDFRGQRVGCIPACSPN